VDKYLDSEDLYNMFKYCGNIKSAKLSLLSENHKSKGYGFIWFSHEGGAQTAMNEANIGKLPLQCSLYKPRSLNEMMTKPFKSVIIKNFPSAFNEDTLVTMFAPIGEA
jgi:RNA recognition motif-containing protein